MFVNQSKRGMDARRIRSKTRRPEDQQGTAAHDQQHILVRINPCRAIPAPIVSPAILQETQVEHFGIKRFIGTSVKTVSTESGASSRGMC